MKKTAKILFWVLFVCLSCLLVFLTNGYIEKAVVNDKIEQFVNRGVYVKTTNNERSLEGLITNEYYKVIKEHDYEEVSAARPVFDIDDTHRYIGSKSDIILTTRNPLRRLKFKLVSDLAGYFSSNFYAGHATINVNDEGSLMIEVVGNQYSNGVRYWDNDWILADDGSPNIIGLRIKDTTIASRDKMVEYCTNQIGKKYNYVFAFSFENSFYCTDLISRAAEYAGININYDHLATTGNDMIVSDNVYIIYYRVKVKQGHYKIYYLSEE